MEKNTYYTYKITAWDNLSKSWKENGASNFKSFVKLVRLYRSNKYFTNIKHYIVMNTEIEVNIDETIV